MHPQLLHTLILVPGMMVGHVHCSVVTAGVAVKRSVLDYGGSVRLWSVREVLDRRTPGVLTQDSVWVTYI
jgi:hypothetical protein